MWPRKKSYRATLLMLFWIAIKKWYHSNEGYCAVLSNCTVYHAVQGDSNFSVCEWNLEGWPNETSSELCTLRTICLVCSCKFRVCRGNPYRWCDQSNKETKMNFENLVLGQQVFQKPRLQSILIFSTFVHPCYLYFFLVFSAVIFKFHWISWKFR